MRVLITGARGQLAQQLAQCVPHWADARFVGRAELDLSDSRACAEAVESWKPDWLINAGAYTAVDQAESDQAVASAVNAGAPQAFAQALDRCGGRLLQVSTDFVFDGAQGCPYQPDQPLSPLGIYGSTKADGEARVADALPVDRFCILRTSWVYGPVGRNFMRTMLNLHAERDQLKVVADQVGCPTATVGLSQACWRALERQQSGILHWSDAGAASWYDFAVAIGELAQMSGLIASAAAVVPIPASSYPTPARRPSYSLLECTGTRAALDLPAVHWRERLKQVIRSMVQL